jgi:hypothetical protein
VTLEDRVKLQLGELLWVNLNLAQQAEDAKVELANSNARAAGPVVEADGGE